MDRCGTRVDGCFGRVGLASIMGSDAGYPIDPAREAVTSPLSGPWLLHRCPVPCQLFACLRGEVADQVALSYNFLNADISWQRTPFVRLSSDGEI